MREKSYFEVMKEMREYSVNKHKSLEEKLLDKKRMLEIQLEAEEYHIDKKDNVYKHKLELKISRIEGFLIGVSYAKIKYTPICENKGYNSVIDNQKEYPHITRGKW